MAFLGRNFFESLRAMSPILVALLIDVDSYVMETVQGSFGDEQGISNSTEEQDGILWSSRRGSRVQVIRPL